jgi:acyl carrier protein
VSGIELMQDRVTKKGCGWVDTAVASGAASRGVRVAMYADEPIDPPPRGGPYPIITEAVRTAAPERAGDVAELDGDIDFWEALDLDSIDHLTVMEQLSAAIGADIPDRDLPRLLTLNQLARYVDDRSRAAHADGRDPADAPPCS